MKICGLTCVEDALACAELGGRLDRPEFPSPSPRYVDPEVASGDRRGLPRRVTAVGVFVDRPAAEVAELAERLGLGVVQLHGHEPPEDLAALGPFRVMRAFRLRRRRAGRIISEYLARAEALGHPPEAVLVDAYVPGCRAAPARRSTQSLLDDRPALPRFILAGGLTPENVAERIARVRPWMVNVASGVEIAPGPQGSGAVAAFIRGSAVGREPGIRRDDRLTSHTDLTARTVDKPRSYSLGFASQLLRRLVGAIMPRTTHRDDTEALAECQESSATASGPESAPRGADARFGCRSPSGLERAAGVPRVMRSWGRSSATCSSGGSPIPRRGPDADQVDRGLAADLRQDLAGAGDRRVPDHRQGDGLARHRRRPR